MLFSCNKELRLELYFTRVEAPLVVSSIPRIYYSKRISKEVPFPEPMLIDLIDGYVESSTLSGDGQLLLSQKGGECL